MCKGQPCQTTANPILDQTKNNTIDNICVTGWSSWINVNQLNIKEPMKYEYMPTFEDLKSTKYNEINGLENEVIKL